MKGALHGNPASCQGRVQTGPFMGFGACSGVNGVNGAIIPGPPDGYGMSRGTRIGRQCLAPNTSEAHAGHSNPVCSRCDSQSGNDMTPSNYHPGMVAGFTRPGHATRRQAPHGTPSILFAC